MKNAPKERYDTSPAAAVLLCCISQMERNAVILDRTAECSSFEKPSRGVGSRARMAEWGEIDELLDERGGLTDVLRKSVI